MTTPTVDTDLIARICRDVTTPASPDACIEAARDPLDDTTWIRLPSLAASREALTRLTAHGISAHDLEDGRLHATGWDVRLLHWRLGTLLSGIDDLTSEWDATAEMVAYHHDRRVAAGVDPDPAEVLADVETAMRSCVPLPHRAPQVQDVDSLLQLISAAEDAYQQLIAQHIDYAERILTDHIAQRHREGAI